MRRKHREAEEADVNLTPLLDIVFIMLIFFIVTATFVKEEGIDVFKPEAQQQPQKPEEKKNIIIRVEEVGTIRVDNRAIDLRAVRANVERLHAERPDGTVVVMPEPGAETGLMVKVLDQVRLAGINNVSIARPPE